MNVYIPHRATDSEMTAFHSPEYVEHLKKVEPSLLGGQGLPENLNIPKPSLDCALSDFKIGENDCPCFEGMFEFS